MNTFYKHSKRQMVRPEVRVTEYAYDNDGRTVQVVAEEGTINYGYDAFGRHIRTWTDYTDVSYTHDDLGRLTHVEATKLNGGTVSQLTRYGYDANGSLLHVELPNGVTSQYGYDPLGRLAELRGTGPFG